MTEAFAGRSGVLVLRGEAGIGKTALLAHLSTLLQGWRVVRAAGIESEMELAYSGLHQVCAPMLGEVERLPVPQRDALATVFGLRVGQAPERFLVGLAALTLFAEVSEQQPLACIVDDAQWIDQASEQILGFVARRLVADRVVVACAARTGIGDRVLAGLPELRVAGLTNRDALALLLANVYGPLDAAVADQIVAESGGNPLALLELPRSRELAGGFALPDRQSVARRLEKIYARRLQRLSPPAQMVLLTAAAEPLGDPLLLRRAIETLGLDLKAASAGVDAGLIRIGTRVEFTHPLVRSAVYQASPVAHRRRAHRALAEATDPDTDPDRRAWHWSRAIQAPDEPVAQDLERSAARARARGGLAATAAFLSRAVELTPDPEVRAERALAAAEVSFQAGAFDAVERHLSTSEDRAGDRVRSARATMLRGHLALASSYGDGAAALLIEAGKQLESFDVSLARRAYLTAWGAAVAANHLGDREIFVDICRAVRMLPPLPAKPHALDLLIQGFAMLTTDGRAAATEVLQRAAEATMGLSVEDLIRWGWLASGASTATWDPDAELRMAERQVEVVRRVGALGELPIQLDGLALSLVARGDFADAAALIAESEGVAAETGAPISRIALLRLRALQGRETEASPLISSVIEQATEERRGAAVMVAHWAASVLNCGLARYDTAASSAQRVTQNAIDPWTILRALPELVEAATRIGDTQLAREALDHLATTTQPAGTDFALGVEARSRALLSDGQTADRLFREAIDRLGRTGLRPETARAQLLFGEHLRREGHRVDAREQLRAAHATFDVIGMEAFAERARRELLATGEKARKRSDSSREDLTPQETQIAQLARDGYSNPEIGAQLFLSPRTIEWHLHHVFMKLGIRSRGELSGALTEDGGQTSSSVGRSFVLLADGSTSPTTRPRKADR